MDARPCRRADRVLARPRGDRSLTLVKRRFLAAGFALVLLFLAVDGLRAPGRQWTTRGLVGAIHLYQATASRLMPRLGVRCRFIPTCSHYGEGALRKHGLFRGTFLTVRRVARCGPWTPAGTYDPP